MHPPGTPGLTLLLHLAATIPVGPIGFRMTLVGAALGAAAVTLVGVILARHGASVALRWGAAAWVLAGLTFVRQCRVVEIYPLATVLLMLTLWGMDPTIPRDKRIGPRLVATFAAVWASWCFGDLRLALAPLVIVAWWFDLRRARPWARWAPPVVIAASLVVLVLPLSSIGGPWMDWGHPQTATSVWSHLQAETIREAFADEILPASGSLWGLHASAAVARLAEDLGAPGLVLTAAALAMLFWTRPWRRRVATRRDRTIALGVLWIVAVQALYIVGINPMGGADRQTAMVLGPLAALIVGRVLAGWLWQRPRLGWAILPLAGTVTIVPAALSSWHDPTVTASWGPHAWTRGAIAQLPPRALLLTQSDDLAAGLAYAQLIEGARPDLVTAPAQHLHKDAPSGPGWRQAPWRAAAGTAGESAQIEAALRAHQGPVAVEHAATTLMRTVRFWSDRGSVPLAIGGNETIALRPSPEAEVDRWLPRLPSRVDKQRLAIALAQRARGLVKVEGDVATAGRTLEVLLERVTEEHPSALVTLAALRDRVGDRSGAIALTRRALQLQPGRSVALTNLALYLARDPASADEARALAERAAALRPWRRDVWERLAQVRTMTGDADGAAAARARAEQITR